ncbi:MAG: helix-turn-helix domain-containing protein [Cyclobacteriaceae bacterium]|nr:helix-turn-helix domain-containing protein [Cyclobacteriaceae bacterium HetDA_MAG_MS6]
MRFSSRSIIYLLFLLVFIECPLESKSATHSLSPYKNVGDEDSTVFYRQQVDSLKKLVVKAFRVGDLTTMKAYTDSVLALAKEYNHMPDIFSAYTNQGIYFSNIGQYDSALAKYLTAIDEVDTSKIDINLQITLLANMGNCYYNMQEYGRSQNCMERVLSLSSKTGKEHRAIISAYQILGGIAHQQGKHEEGLAYMQKVLEKAVSSDRKNKVLAARNSVIYSLIKNEAYDTAATFTKETLLMYDTDNSIDSRATTIIYMGEIYVAEAQYDSALHYLDKAEKIAFEYSFPKKQKSIYELKSTAYGAIGNQELANYYQKLYTQADRKLAQNASAAVQLDIESASKEKRQAIKKLEEFHVLNSQRNLMVLFFILAMSVILSVAVFRYRIKRNQIVADSDLLYQEMKDLRDENQSLKETMIALNETKSEANEKNRKSSFTEKQSKELMHKVLEYMENKKPYLRLELNQSELAEELDLTVHQLSEILNDSFGQNFNTFINLYRVETAKQLLRNERYANYKLMAIGYEAGFQSKTSFNRSFKQLTGYTPTDYRKVQLRS